MDKDLKNKIQSDPHQQETPPPGMVKVTDMDSGEVTFEKAKTPEDYEQEGQIMDFAEGSDGGAATDGEGA